LWRRPSAREVFFIGQRFAFDGIVTSYEHGVFFDPWPACNEPLAIGVRDFPTDLYVGAGGTKGGGLR
jgi:hypothetical protein